MDKIANHIDEDFTNNYYKNLEWITVEDNSIYSNGRPVIMIDKTTKKEIRRFDSISLIKKLSQFKNKKINSAHITSVCRGRMKSTYGYLWKYVDDVDKWNITTKDIKVADSQDDIFD